MQKIIATVQLNSLFSEISKELGFTDEMLKQYEDNIFDLLIQWENQGYVEIYENDSERKIGRLKDSNSVVGSSPWYIDLFHARISENNDPLLVLRRDDEFSFSVRFLANHNQLFGSKTEKNQPDLMRKIRMLIDSYIQKGN
ncbi:hypothetical protein [Lonepinella sp. MS14436]|uniref:hypothetical protein n=1 Tax=Lonepinella sp. MS14436 TaxID=3003619 RepID=UPI0036DDC3DF